MPGPAATIGGMHVCPMCTGTVPHVGGPVTGPGVPTVLIGGKPAAVMGDMCTCAGPPDTIVQGEATVLIGGKPAATLGSMTAHGGTITVGEPTVLIGTGAGAHTEIMPIQRIPFPEIRLRDRMGAAITGNSKKLKEAEENQNILKQGSEPHPLIIQADFIDEYDEVVIHDSLMGGKIIRMRVKTVDIPDGDTITFNLTRKSIVDKDGKPQSEEELITLTGTVNSGVAIVEYEVPDFDKKEEQKN